MITGLDPKQIIEYASKFDKGDKKTIFLLGIITGKDRIKFASSIEEGNNNPEQYYGLIKEGLKGIRDFNGKDNITEITDEVMDSLPMPIILELFEKLCQINFLSEQEAKN